MKTVFVLGLNLLLAGAFLALSADVAEEVKLSEHCRAHELFPAADADCVAAASGSWSDPDTWGRERTPGRGARVRVPNGISVRVDRVFLESIAWIRVEGELSFAEDCDTGVKVGTLFVSEEGVLRIGGQEDRIGQDVSARVVFAERADRSVLRKTDPFDLSGGLISFGQVQVFGADKTGFGLASGGVEKGTVTAEFSSPVVGWRTGDKLLIPGTAARAEQDELRLLKEISPDRMTVTFDRALAHDHPVVSGIQLPIGNLTRNVRFESEVGVEDESILRRGHIMLMHTHMGTRIEGAGFHRLGRTKASQVHTRSNVDTEGNVVSGSDSNPIGRYALHFHARTGASVRNLPQVVRGCVITDSPKHGLVNHGGHVLAEGNVTYRVRGSHFFGENGSEIGSFVGNLAIRSAGTGEDLKSRMYSADMGHTGHGFWLQGGGIEVKDNYAFGHRDSAYIFHMKPHMMEGGRAVRFAAENLREPHVAGGMPDVDPSIVPIRFSGNVAASCGSGLTVRYHKRQADHGVASVFELSSFWNTSMDRHAVDFDYSKGITLRDMTILGDTQRPKSVGILTNGESGELVCENVRIEGFAVGITVPRRGVNVVSGGYLSNQRNLIIQETVEPGREVTIRNVGFGEQSSGSGDPFDIVMLGRGDWLENSRRFPARWHADELANFPMQFERDLVRLDDRQVYFYQQAPMARPFAGMIDGSDASITGEQLLEEHGLAVGGALAPADALRVPRIFGLVGAPSMRSAPLEPLRLEGSDRSNQMKNYVAVVHDGEGLEIRSKPTALNDGWNLVSLSPGLEGRSVLVYGDSIKPRLELRNSSWEIHPADITYGFLVVGRLHDQLGTVATDRKFNYFAKKLPEPVDGVIELEVPASDLAGNKIKETVKIRVTESATPRQANVDPTE